MRVEHEEELAKQVIRIMRQPKRMAFQEQRIGRVMFDPITGFRVYSMRIGGVESLMFDFYQTPEHIEFNDPELKAQIIDEMEIARERMRKEESEVYESQTKVTFEGYAHKLSQS